MDHWLCRQQVGRISAIILNSGLNIKHDSIRYSSNIIPSRFVRSWPIFTMSPVSKWGTDGHTHSHIRIIIFPFKNEEGFIFWYYSIDTWWHNFQSIYPNCWSKEYQYIGHGLCRQQYGRFAAISVINSSKTFTLFN